MFIFSLFFHSLFAIWEAFSGKMPIFFYFLVGYLIAVALFASAWIETRYTTSTVRIT